MTNTTGTLTKDFKEHRGAELLLCLFGPAEEMGADKSKFKSDALTRLCGKPDYMVLDKAFVGGYHEAKDIFADLGKALSTLLRSRTISRHYLAKVLNAMFNNFSMHIDNQAACLLFSCEKLVKLYLAYVAQKEEGVKRFAQLLVALVTVCGKLSNHLNQGLDKILEWAMKLPDFELMETFAEELWAEFTARINTDNLSPDTISQFGVFITMMSSNKDKEVSEDMEVEE